MDVVIITTEVMGCRKPVCSKNNPQNNIALWPDVYLEFAFGRLGGMTAQGSWLDGGKWWPDKPKASWP